MQAPSTDGVRFGGVRELLLPFGIATAFVLYYVVHLPAALVGGLLFPLLALFVWAPSWAVQSTRAFDRDAVEMLARGRARDLDARYGRALGMRLFAPPAVSAERRALIATETGRVRDAHAAYRAALADYGASAPLRVLLGYAHACFQLGHDAEAVRVYRQLRDGQGSLPGVEINLAHAMVRSGDDLRDALGILERAAARHPGPPSRERLLLVRALAHAKLGEPACAHDLVDQVGELQDALLAELREQVDAALQSRTGPRA